MTVIHQQTAFWVRSCGNQGSKNIKLGWSNEKTHTDTLVAAKAHGFKLPDDIDDQLLDDLAEIVAHEWFAGAMQSEEIRKLSLGRLMGDIRDRMVRKVNGSDKQVGEQDLKMAIYSGHDT